MNPHSSSEPAKSPKPSGSAKHSDSKSSRQLGRSTACNSNQSALSKKTNDTSNSSGAHEHQSPGPSIHDNPTQPYLPLARSWGSGDPTRAGVAHGLSGQDMTAMDCWLSQDSRNEMWNNVHGVYGTFSQQTDLGAVDDGTNLSGEAVHGSEAGEFS